MLVALNRLATTHWANASPLDHFAHLASEIFLSSPHSEFFSNPLGLSYRKKFFKLQDVFPAKVR
jgi:hypothetical protein